MSAELVAFYRARLDEAEQLARDAIAPAAMYPYGDTSLPRMPVESWPDEARGYLGGPWGEHCAAHDPTAVLADVAAKRALLDQLGDAEIYAAPSYAALRDVGRADGLRLAVRLLAAVYAGHPDYRQEWRP